MDSMSYAVVYHIFSHFFTFWKINYAEFVINDFSLLCTIGFTDGHQRITLILQKNKNK